ncbi:nitroreductase family protein [Dictyobacter arantiisoli]|uniref:Putative NAD(P)H nitroreductase n=1 Tax=Dictyobacter arantiisoli TaxID=2014874 RepID=A0A5A5T6L8_9CHLR|nr:nitroreductase [Dictyobacter arantiisoli]GCF06663.1 nitroreductase [Dictyobacter arantiisoli]
MATTTQSSISEIIKQRRSIGKMTDQVPTRAQIELILEAATHAPNHHKAEPWKFFVLAGEARRELGSVMAQTLIARQKLKGQEVPQAVIEKEQQKPMRSPIIIAVAAEHPTQNNVLQIENIEATAAAVQNMLLVAAELGLAAIWRTGDAAFDPAVKQWFGLVPEDEIVAFFYLGYPASQPMEREPLAAASKTTWLGF